MRIKREDKVRYKFVVFPKQCFECKDYVFLDGMLMENIRFPYDSEKRYYCKECFKKEKKPGGRILL